MQNTSIFTSRLLDPTVLKIHMCVSYDCVDVKGINSLYQKLQSKTNKKKKPSYCYMNTINPNEARPPITPQNIPPHSNILL